MRHRSEVSRRVLFLAAAAALLVFLALPQSAHASTPYVVDTTVDDALKTACTVVPNDCSLRGAITHANTAPGADTITVPAGTYILAILGVNEDASATGDLDITSDLTVNGAGADITTIDGNHIDRVVDLPYPGSPTNVSISGLTVTHGKTLNSSPGGGGGGGIKTAASVTSLSLTNVAVDDNEGSDGGGIFVGGPVTLNNSTVSRNTAAVAGGIDNYINGPLILNNSTVSGNTGNFAGGIFANGPTLVLNNSTVSGNTGGLWGTGVTIKNTILADNTFFNCSFSFPGFSLASLGHNLSTDNTCKSAASGGSVDSGGGLNGQAGDLNNTPAGLAPLALNPPGTTETQALLPGSLAIDAGDNATCLATDQRGVSRPQPIGGTCDIGAFESSMPLASISSTGEFCISGSSTGVGWNWTVWVVTKPFPYTLVPYIGMVAPGLIVGSPASVIADAWVASINLNPALHAAQTSPNCFTVTAPLAPNALTASSLFLDVDGCPINYTPGGCTFNPTVVYVAPVGGAVALSVPGAGSPVPWTPLSAVAASVMAVMGAGLWYGRRRWLR